VIFYWTPPHTWALGLLIRTDYERVNIPMLPWCRRDGNAPADFVVYPADDRRDAAVVCVPDDGWDLLCGSAAAERDVPGARAQVWRLPETDKALAKRLYKFSQSYLALLFLAMILDKIILA